jgi:hypothetical protein
MANVFKKVIDRQKWVQVAPTPNAHSAGMGMASDLRNDVTRNPFVYQLTSATVLNRYNIIQKAWDGTVVSPALTGTFGAGAGAVFAPSLALTGAIAAGSSTTQITTSTVLTSVGMNMLANRGGGSYGYKIRIIGSAAGSSGKIEERWITGNTAGTTPTFLLDTALSFTPATGDRYEILCGKVFMLSAGVLAAGMWKSFEVGTNTVSGNLSTTNLPATVSTDFSAIALDEQYVPYTRNPGEGFVVGAGTYNGGLLKCLTATAIGASSITGQAAAGDASVLANEYRNFQIRVVEDTVNVTAVGQRRIIASHTAGASPVYTLGAAWTVTPSANAKFVIEYPNLILLWSSASSNTFTYNYSGASITNGTNTIANDAWSVTYFTTRPGAMGAGCTTFASFGIEPDAAKNARHSFIHSFRGNGTTSLDVLDIAGAITGSFTNVVYDGARAFQAGSCGKYAPADLEGRFGYINIYVASAINQMYRYDVKNRVLSAQVPTDWIQAGVAAAGDRVATYTAVDGTDKYTVVLLMSHLSTISQELIVQT